MKNDIIAVYMEHLNKQGIPYTRLANILRLSKGSFHSWFSYDRTLPAKTALQIAEYLNLEDEFFFHYPCYVMQSLELSNSKNSTNRKKPMRNIIDFLSICFEKENHVAIESTCAELSKNHDTFFEPDKSLFNLVESLRNESLSSLQRPIYSFISKIADYKEVFKTISDYRLLIFAIKSQRLDVQTEILSSLNRRIDDLPPNMYANALLKILTYYYSVENWERMCDCADKLINVGTQIINTTHSDNPEDAYDEPLEFNRVKYLGQGFLMKASALRNLKFYKESKMYIKLYSEMDWISNQSAEDQEEIRRFKVYGEANGYHLELLQGNFSVVDQYRHYLSQHPDEKLPGIVTIIEVANKYGIAIDDEIKNEAFELIILKDELMNHHSYYSKEKQLTLFVKLFYEFSLHLLHIQDYSNGYTLALNCLELSIIQGNSDMIVKAIATLEYASANATEAQLKSYDKVRKGVLKYEKILGHRYASA